MKKSLLLTCILFPLSVMATESQWVLLGGHIPVLYPKEEKANVILMIGDRSTFNISIMDVRGKVDFDSCGTDEMREAAEIPPLTINNKAIKFVQACIGGTGILAPQTDKGKKYLNDLVLGGKEVTVELNNGLIVHYPGSDIKSLKNKLEQQDSAM